MTWRTYPLFRSLHLYSGLFISPILLGFALSVIFLVHGWIPGSGAARAARTVSNLTIPDGIEKLQGGAQLKAARSLLDQLAIKGEINFVRFVPAEQRLSIPVMAPGADAMVDVNLAQRSATVATRQTGVWDAMVFLHKMPGPHNVALRGNTVFMQVWRVLTDATVYMILFLSLTGIYLWVVLRGERRIGLIFAAAGALSFGGLVYALIA